MVTIILLIVFIFLVWLVLKVYFEKFDTVIGYTGGLGSGKTFIAVTKSCRLLRKNRFKVWFYNFRIKISNIFRVEKKKKIDEVPNMYSSIPVFIKQKNRKFKTYNLVKLRYKYWLEYNKNSFIDRYITRDMFEDMLSKSLITKFDISKYIESSFELTESHLLLQEHINEKSIVFIDEIGGYVNQYEYQNPNVLGALDEFIRLFRHYTKGGYFVCTEQCSDGICKPIRVRLNKVFNLMNFKGYFNLFYRVNIRELSLSEDIKTIEQNMTEDNMKTKIGLFPLRKKYDTYCYSERYKGVPFGSYNAFNELKRYTLLKVSHNKIYRPLTTDKKINKEN